MDSSHAMDCLDRVSPAGRTVYVTFRADGFNGVRMLCNLQNRLIRLSQPDLTYALAIAETNQWGSGRTLPFIFLKQDSEAALFMNLLAEFIETIDVGTHSLQGLVSRREKKRKIFAEAIMHPIIDAVFQEAASWDMELVSEFNDSNRHFPLIKFRLIYDGETVCEVNLDGWSGNISGLPDSPLLFTESGSKRVIDGMLVAIIKYCEGATAISV